MGFPNPCLGKGWGINFHDSQAKIHRTAAMRLGTGGMSSPSSP